MVVHVGVPDAVDDGCHEQQRVDERAHVEAPVQIVDGKELEPRGHLDYAGYDAIEDSAQQRRRNDHRPHRARACDGVVLEIVDHHDGRDGKQIEQMDAYRQAHQIGYQDYPAVRLRLGRRVFPLEDSPEHHRRKERRHGVDLALDGREPERVRKRVGQRAHKAGAQHRPHAPRLGVLHVVYKNSAPQVSDGPAQKQDGECAGQGRHYVYHLSHRLSVGGYNCEHARHNHEERRSGRVPHQQFVGRGYEFSTVPETGTVFSCQYVGDGRNGKGQPAHYIVEQLVSFHSLWLKNFCFQHFITVCQWQSRAKSTELFSVSDTNAAKALSLSAYVAARGTSGRFGPVFGFFGG